MFSFLLLSSLFIFTITGFNWRLQGGNSHTYFILTHTYIYIYIAKRFSNPRKQSTPCEGDGKRK